MADHIHSMECMCYPENMIPRKQSSPVSAGEVDAVPDLAALFDELIRFEIELWNAVDARLRADCDLPLSRFEPMRVISRRAPCRVQDVAEEMSITVGGVSKLVDRIEAAGHCRRRPNPEDKRSSVIEPTPAGRRLLATAITSFEDELRIRLGSAVSAASLQQFSATLTQLRSAGHRADSTE
jgi:DNA-binding MarR family transcriptional regulator